MGVMATTPEVFILQFYSLLFLLLNYQNLLNF